MRKRTRRRRRRRRALATCQTTVVPFTSSDDRHRRAIRHVHLKRMTNWRRRQLTIKYSSDNKIASGASRRAGQLMWSWTAWLLWIGCVVLNGYFFSDNVDAVILSGSSESFARYPKWSQTYENQLSFEFKTRTRDALLLYTDDGGVNGNFYAISIVEGRIQLDFRLGDKSEDGILRRLPVQIRVPSLSVDDNKWHKFVLFQAWENVKVEVDEVMAFKILNQRSFAFGALRNSSDVFVGGLPKDEIRALSSPLRRHARHFAGSVINLRYRLYPHGVSAPQLIDSYGIRQTDDDYCDAAAKITKSAEKLRNDSATNEYCRNGGHCYSTNTGPKCDCAFTDFSGRQCETKKTIPEVSLYGNEWIGYDLADVSMRLRSGYVDLTGVWSRRETLSVHFKTTHANGLLFVAGDHQNYVQLALERGVLLAVSKLDGSEKRLVRVFNKSIKPANFDDGVWHHVLLYRDLRVMRVRVDGGWADEVKQLATAAAAATASDGAVSNVAWLGNSFAFVGGAPMGRAHVPEHAHNFRGCLKKVSFEVDTIRLQLIELADQGFGKSVVRTSGDVLFSCGAASQTPDLLSFHSGQEYLTLPKWNSLSTGSLGFQFRTFESDGLILYHGMRNFANATTADFIAFELVDGHLFVVINLGSGHVRLQASSKRVNEGNVWHSVTMERAGRTGTISVDMVKIDFSTPGISANLIIDEPIYVGAAPWNPVVSPSGKTLASNEANATNGVAKPMRFPAAVWTAQLRTGFIGCLKNLRINGINAQIASVFEEELKRDKLATSPIFADNKSSHNNSASVYKKRGISTSCPMNEVDYCTRNSSSPCQNLGHCESALNTFKCNCANTLYEGRTCTKKPKAVSLPLKVSHDLETAMVKLGKSLDAQSLKTLASANVLELFRVPGGALSTEAEDIYLKFRTDDDSAVLFDTAALYAAQKHTRLLLLLINGELELHITIASGNQFTFNWGQSLNDNHWHYAQIKRRGEKLRLRVDGKSEDKKLSVVESTGAVIYVEEISVGRAIRPIKSRTQGHLSGESQERAAFEGYFLQFYFNRYDVLKQMRQTLAFLKSIHLRSSADAYNKADNNNNNNVSMEEEQKLHVDGGNESEYDEEDDEEENDGDDQAQIDAREKFSDSFASNTISIERVGGFVGYSKRMIQKVATNSVGLYRISFKFRTLMPSGLLFFMVNDGRVAANNDGNTSGREKFYDEFIVIKLADGRIQYTCGHRQAPLTYKSRGDNGRFLEESVTTPLTKTDHNFLARYNDMRWHTVDVVQESHSGTHRVFVDDTVIELHPRNARRLAQIRGHVFLGGAPANFTTSLNADQLPPVMNNTRGIRGCFSNLKLGKSRLKLWHESDYKTFAAHTCTELEERCAKSSCHNNGICHQGWKNVVCDCSWTTFSGRRCQDESTAYYFDGKSSSIFYEYQTSPSLRASATVKVAGDDRHAYRMAPSTSADKLVLAFQTHHPDGVLLSVQCAVNDDYLTLFLGGGYVQVRYNLGSADHHLGYFDTFVNDGKRHIVKIWRQRANLTLFLDAQMPVKYAPQNQRELYTLNSQWRISVGASFNLLHRTARTSTYASGNNNRTSTKYRYTTTRTLAASRQRRTAGSVVQPKKTIAAQQRKQYNREASNNQVAHRVYDQFHGNITGVNFNGIHILELYAGENDRTFCVGQPRFVHMAAPTFYGRRADASQNDANADQGFAPVVHHFENLFETDDLPSTSFFRHAEKAAGGNGGAQQRNDDYGEFVVTDGLLDQSPLGCLPYATATDCEREEDAGDGFLTPILPKSLKQRPTLAPLADSDNHQSQSHSASTSSSKHGEKPKHSGVANGAAQSAAAVASNYGNREYGRRTTVGRSGVKNSQPTESTVANDSKMRKEGRQGGNGRRPNDDASRKLAPGYYEPPGGWPPRTRTGPDGRRLIGIGNSYDQNHKSKESNKLRNEDEEEEENEDENSEKTDEDLGEDLDDDEEQSGENSMRYFNKDGKEVRPANGQSVENLWTDLGRAIERKPWQRPTPLLPQQQSPNEPRRGSNNNNKYQQSQPLPSQTPYEPNQRQRTPSAIDSTTQRWVETTSASTVTLFATPNTVTKSSATVVEKSETRKPDVWIPNDYRKEITNSKESITTTKRTTKKTETASSTTKTTTKIITTTSRTTSIKPTLTTLAGDAKIGANGDATATTTPKLTRNAIIGVSTMASLEASMLFTFVAPQNDTFYSTSPYLLSGVSGLHGGATSTTTLRSRTRTTPVYDHTLYAVRPTTPMNQVQYSTVKTAESYTPQIPRTALVVLASLSLVLIVALILIVVFCKRSNSSENYYPMICSGNEKTMTGTTGGYTAIPPSSDASPQFPHQTIANGNIAQSTFDHHTTSGAANGSVGGGGYTNKAMTLLRNGNGYGGATAGYQPIKGSTLPHPGHAQSTAIANGHAHTQNGNADGGASVPIINGFNGTRMRQTTASLVDGGSGTCGTIITRTAVASENAIDGSGGAPKKKDFKEWYV